MFLECLDLKYGIEVGLRKVLFSYYLKENNKEKGRYHLTLRHERSHLVTCLRSNDRAGRTNSYMLEATLCLGRMMWGSYLRIGKL